MGPIINIQGNLMIAVFPSKFPGFSLAVNLFIRGRFGIMFIKPLLKEGEDESNALTHDS